MSEQSTVRANSESVAHHVRQAILNGEFVPRQRLIEADLSTEFDATRASVRHALMTLEGEGLIERMPNRGARVRAISPNEAIEIVEVRVGLEVLVARRAAERLDADRSTALADLRDGMRTAVESGDLVRYAALNQEMDAVLREISDHGVANQLLERLRAQAARHQFRLAFDPQRANASVEEHAAIVDAVIARDPDAAATATETHLAAIIQAISRTHA